MRQCYTCRTLVTPSIRGLGAAQVVPSTDFL